MVIESDWEIEKAREHSEESSERDRRKEWRWKIGRRRSSGEREE
ncbi:hypothetical protein L195_g027582 [Trifolium pratense]|uniref:Uncharacterized protein n=1 Tax=Trifolium pratense TaxID=57577 RepID=A0A2K3KZI6_TRIPR|nr:hypothetical protein L195_g027582 [Trifolium pratense]